MTGSISGCRPLFGLLRYAKFDHDCRVVFRSCINSPFKWRAPIWLFYHNKRGSSNPQQNVNFRRFPMAEFRLPSADPESFQSVFSWSWCAFRSWGWSGIRIILQNLAKLFLADMEVFACFVNGQRIFLPKRHVQFIRGFSHPLLTPLAYSLEHIALSYRTM